MISISVCMIVKNEQLILKRCLDCLKKIADEIIIVDTGSTDQTKEIALNYTDKIYDFKWIDDFSAARNFSFSKATMEYIYTADADEIIDDANINKFLKLKQVLLPEIEVVNMYYTNQLAFDTVYNFDKEQRPKLFKRLRTMRWRDQIHEVLEFNPIVFDSDIEIIHAPLTNHANRDFEIYQRIIQKKEYLSERLVEMYARELFIAGTDNDFLDAYPFFSDIYEKDTMYPNLWLDIQCVLMKCYRLLEHIEFFTDAYLNEFSEQKMPSELFYEAGEYYYQKKAYEKAIEWFQAAYQAECILNIHYGSDYPLSRISNCYEQLHNTELALTYEKLAEKALQP